MATRGSLQNILIVQDLESFLISEHIQTVRVTHANFPGTEVPAIATLPDLSLCVSSSASSCVSSTVSLNMLVNVTVSLSCVSCSSNLMEPKEGMRGSLVGLSPKAVGSDAVSRQVVSELR